MPRRFAPIEPDELRRRVMAKVGVDGRLHPSLLMEHFARDLKVRFDCENFESAANEGRQSDDPPCGVHVLPNGLTFWGFSAGGDWEFPIYFIVYWDGHRLRAYVPTAGNPWNTTTKLAYGNDDAADLANAKRRWPREFRDADEVDPGDFDCSWAAIKADVEARLTPAADD